MSLINCQLTNGLPLGCRDNTGGVYQFYVSNFTDSMIFGYTASGEITSISGATPSWFTFNQPTSTAEFSQTGAFSTENSTVMTTQNLTFTIAKMDAESLALIRTLELGVFRVVLKDRNGKFFLMGKEVGARVSASTIQSGKAGGDLNGATVTLTADERRAAEEILATTITPYIVAAT
jgi:hypothetical protein